MAIEKERERDDNDDEAVIICVISVRWRWFTWMCFTHFYTSNQHESTSIRAWRKSYKGWTHNDNTLRS